MGVTLRSRDGVDGEVSDIGIPIVVDGAGVDQLTEVDGVQVCPGDRHNNNHRYRPVVDSLRFLMVFYTVVVVLRVVCH